MINVSKILNNNTVFVAGLSPFAAKTGANFTTLSFTEPELSPIEILHGGIGNFAFFLRKIVEITNIFSWHPKTDVALAETHFLTITDCSILYATGVTRVQNVVLRRIGGRGHSGHVTKMAVTPFDPQWPITPCYTPGLSNWRPAVRPAGRVDAAREAKLAFYKIVKMLTIDLKSSQSLIRMSIAHVYKSKNRR